MTDTALCKQATAASVERFADCGPGRWWFVHHPDGYLIEVGANETRATQIAHEINCGRIYLNRQTSATAPEKMTVCGFCGTEYDSEQEA